MRVLTVNCGSSSLKFDVFEAETTAEPRRLLGGSVERIGIEGTYLDAGGPRQDVEAPDHAAALDAALEHLRQSGALDGLGAVGHRVVHGGIDLTAPALIDEGVLDAIRAATDLAPLHNGPALQVIEAARERFGETAPMTASFDTSFFAAMPAAARTYALPRELTERLGIRRFGFHGLAHRYMTERYRLLRPDISRPRLITLQLGNGCSATASVDGAPIDTSMGYTPLEGLVMGTRSGDIDPGLPLHLQRAGGMDAEAVESLLNNESGLLGLSGISRDLRDLDPAAERGDANAKLAVDVFRRRLVKYIGAYLTLLGGADAIVFGGGIGEHNVALREHVCRAFAWAGLDLDEEANRNTVAEDGLISRAESRIEAWVVRVDEASVIAREAVELLG